MVRKQKQEEAEQKRIDYLFELVNMYYAFQKERNAFANRMAMIEQGRSVDTLVKRKVFEKYKERFADLEQEIASDIAMYVQDHPMYDYITGVKGIGACLGAQILSQIDIRKADTVSALWRYSGLSVDAEGKADRLKKGQKSVFNTRLKMVMYKVSTQFLRNRSPYAKFYYNAKAYYKQNRPDWTKLHCDYAARRKMMKMFMSHLWEVYRKLEGLPTPAPYVFEKLGHTHMISPHEFGWFKNSPEPTKKVS